MRAVFLDYDTVSAGDLDVSQIAAAVDDLQLFAIDADMLAARIRDAEVVLLNKQGLDRPQIYGAPRLQLVVMAGTGTNHIDLQAARERGVAVCNVRAYCTDSVVQQVWALVLSLTQHVIEYDRIVRGGTWSGEGSAAVLRHPIRELAGRTFGVVGWGELGRGTAQIAKAFGMKVAIAQRRGAEPVAGRVPFDDMLEVADVVSLHCPLDDTTRGLLGARELALMKSDALLINTARGGLIDSAALAAALRAGRLGGAGLDVMAQEPPDPNDPLLAAGIPNLLVTPHVAWAAREARQRCMDEMAANIRAFREGGRRGRVI